jgi:glycerophosphoryl diester phosphodiesterase
MTDGTVTKAYNETLKTLQTIDLGEGQVMPTLDDVFDLLGSSMIVNVEIKAPYDSELKHQYDMPASCYAVFNLIRQRKL